MQLASLGVTLPEAPDPLQIPSPLTKKLVKKSTTETMGSTMELMKLTMKLLPLTVVPAVREMRVV